MHLIHAPLLLIQMMHLKLYVVSAADKTQLLLNPLSDSNTSADTQNTDALEMQEERMSTRSAGDPGSSGRKGED